MILLRLLDHDLHRSRGKAERTPMWVETPARPEFLPAIVSLSTPKFDVAKKLIDGRIRSGVFLYDSDRIDEIIPDLMNSAYDLSVDGGFGNIFDLPLAAFEYIRDRSGTKAQPHMALIPSTWSRTKIMKWAGDDTVSEASADGSNKGHVLIYNKICRLIPCGVQFPIFFSRPDFVGLYTQIVGGRSSIVLHNVKNGLAFNAIRKNVRRKST